MNVIITDLSVWLGVVVGGAAVIGAFAKWLERRMTAAVTRSANTLKDAIARDLKADLGAVSHIKEQLSPNHGSSALDKINATDRRLEAVERDSRDRFDRLETKLDGVQSAVDTLSGAFAEHVRTCK